MLSRKECEGREVKMLAPFAAKSAESLGREHDEPECPFRPVFQRDRDRIIHCEAFRRLEYKTQVFVNHEGDYYRTRLTHTLEVVQISRGLARTLGLNEDLAEAIALAHDLGHTPFGHRGETVLNKLMEGHGGFEHNHQSYRVVTKLERRYPDFDGLNLSHEVREGIAKHQGEYDNPDIPGFQGRGYPTLEAQVVDVADQIAYINHDLDDGLKSGMITFGELEAVDLWRDTLGEIRTSHPGMREKFQKYQTVRRLIHLFITDIYQETARRMEELGIESFTDVREKGKEAVRFSTGMKQKKKQLLDFLFENLYRHQRVERMAQKSEKILTDLFHNYLKNPRTLPPRLCSIIESEGNAKRRVCDYIAGMTDRFALDEHAKLFDPHVKV